MCEICGVTEKQLPKLFESWEPVGTLLPDVARTIGLPESVVRRARTVLEELESTLPGVTNYNIAIRSRGDELIFLRKILPGGADRSYGIEVAKLAGLPDKVLQRARQVLEELETANNVQYAAPRREAEQVSLGSLGEGEVLDALRRCQPDTLTPIEAMGLLYELKKKLSQG